MTKKQLEAVIKDLQLENDNLRQRNKALLDSKENEFEKTPLFIHTMEMEKYYRSVADMYILADQTKKEKQNKITRLYQKLLADNQALCQKHDVEYWIGISHIWEDGKVRDLERLVDSLQAQIAAQKTVIAHLRQYIGMPLEQQEVQAASSMPAATKSKGGRPGIDIQTKKRVRKMYPDFTIRQIAQAEGLSIGAVSKILHEK